VVCLSVTVGHVCEPCKNVSTDRDAVWETHASARNHALDGVEIPPMEGAVFLAAVHHILKYCNL